VPFSGEAGPSVGLSILEGLPVGVWVARAPGGELIYANRRFTEILGMDARDDVRAGEYTPAYSLQDREGRPFPEERLPFVQALARRETVVVEDIVIARRDGRRVFVRAFGEPQLDDAGDVARVVVAFFDITAEVTAAISDVVARHKLEAALAHAPIVLFANDVAGTITVAEGAALENMGVTSEALVGRSIHDIYKDNPSLLAANQRALAGETFTFTTQIGDVTHETWMSPMRGPTGEIGGVIGVANDVTERLRLQRQFSHAERLAALGRLAASVAHEINNPLAYAMEALRIAGDLVGAAGAAAHERARLDELLREAGDGMDRVRHITRDLKLFSREDEDARRPQELGAALAAATKMVATRVGARARIDLAPGPRVTVLADENRLVQIFVNLILNAADALPMGGVERNRISLASRLGGRGVVVEVADNGPGIPLALRDRVFEPFFTTKAVGDGTGLGLFVTRNLVEALGGTIALGDAPGGGALFSIDLPTVAPEPQADARAAPGGGVVDGGRRARILIIDDEPQLARIFQVSLAAQHDVRSFTEGRAALGHLLDGPAYDLILCDIMMADMSGMKVYEELRRARPGQERALVFMTGGVFDPAVAEFLASVPNDCVDKPFDVRAEVARRLSAR
jgi:two-component system cell cycle sensor histidine kinase/response regulator CckA